MTLIWTFFFWEFNCERRKQRQLSKRKSHINRRDFSFSSPLPSAGARKFPALENSFFLPVPHTFSLFCDEIYAKDQDACGKTFLFLLLFRIKMSQNIRNILGELPPYEKKVVYDLDQLIRNKNTGKEINSKLAYYCAL